MTPSPEASSREERRPFWGLLRRRHCLVPTWRGWLATLLAVTLVGLWLVRSLYGFLAVTHSVPGGFLVVEGWVPDDAMQAAVGEFRTNHYERLMVIGGPLEQGAPLSEYHTFAEMGAAVLVRLGLSTNAIQAVPAPDVPQDRTYAADIALRQWLEQHGLAPTSVNLLSIGPHARRSRLLLQTALGKQVTVGIVALPPQDYDPAHWWGSSAGFRTVTGEALAYVYARLLFRASDAQSARGPH